MTLICHFSDNINFTIGAGSVQTCGTCHIPHTCRRIHLWVLMCLLKFPWLLVTIIAYHTSVAWTFNCEDPYVYLEMTWPIQLFPTHLTSAAIFTCVGPHMDFELLLLSFVGTLTFVDPQLYFEIAWLTELFPTRLTSVGTLPCVEPHVCFKIAWLIELFPTYLTSVRTFTCVDPHVYFESTWPI